MSEQIKPVAWAIGDANGRISALSAKYSFREDAQSHVDSYGGECVLEVVALYSAETVQQLQERNDRLLAALKDSQKVYRDALGFWNNDQDSKVGKILRALSGDLKGYRNDIDSINAIIAEAEKQV